MGNHEQEPLPNPLKIEEPAPGTLPSLPQCWGHEITADYKGLDDLAHRLQDFVRRANPLITRQVGYVNALVATDNDTWRAISAREFQRSFGQDAALMSGFHKTLLGMAKVINNLARGLATIQRDIDSAWQRGISAGEFVTGASVGHPEVPASPIPGNQVSNAKYAAMLRWIVQKKEDADQACLKTATELVLYQQYLMAGLDYYTKGTGIPGTLDPNGLLSGPAKTASDQLAKNLEQQMEAEKKALAKSGVDLNSVIADLQKFSGKANTVGTALGDIENLRNATSAMGRAKSIGPIAGDIALFLLMVPK
ncbi:hypothetical protein [Actinomadura rupiterrae]|uniref:hypothetical protein n=1 Tax=Actinomadura rupiterrae TaxID=559627 RepID=UPI0020A25606|nr:hypothetical protein [Actinomadura rupiterrae]MCP2337493.1 uncharacterized protein YukE [Actinomadura rupiterrae]